ncbi:MAG: hypothetical protein IT578_06325 [Verrucomicrobiae bacterium]|nr:hypothetical protein [Verrucomicrobiae bacterium]
MSELNERAEKAAKISARPDRYKVCEGCESIVGRNANACPNCHGYRFDESGERVRAQAAVLASRPQISVTPDDLET